VALARCLKSDVVWKQSFGTDVGLRILRVTLPRLSRQLVIERRSN